jgi:PrtD family type I secretion system ABC transporter
MSQARHWRDFESGDNAVGAALGGVRVHVLSAFLFTAIVNILFLASPIYMMQLYGRVLDSGSVETLTSLSIALLLALLAMAAADAGRARLLARAGARLDRRIAAPAIGEALRRGEGRMPHAVADVELARRFVAGGALATLMDAPFTILFFAVLFLLHPWLGGVATLGALVILAVAMTARLWEAPREARIAATTRAAAAMTSALEHDRGEVRALGLERGLGGRAASIRNDGGLLRRESGETTAWSGAVVRALRLTAHNGALATGALLAIDGALTPSAMLAAAILVGRALGPIDALPGALRQAATARAALARLRSLTELARPAMAAQNRDPKAKSLAIDVRRLVVAAPDAPRAALRSISFSIEAGEVIAIAGAGGSGKSTLARCLAGAEKPKSGSVLLDGVEMRAAASSDPFARVGWLPQDAPLYEGTVAENIARFGPCDEAETRRVAQLAGAMSAIERLPGGFDAQVGPDGRALTPSARQAVALARALYGDPPILVLDQPTSHMDAEGEVAALNAVRSAKRRGATVVLVSHKPILAALADRILMLEDGAIAVFETRTTVLDALRRQSVHGVPDARTSAPIGLAQEKSA